MNTTVPAYPDALSHVPSLHARLRLPRHHAAQRDQAIHDALDLVRRLEDLTARQVSDDPTPDIDRYQVRSDDAPDSEGSPCTCTFAEQANHDLMLQRIRLESPRAVFELIDLADIWDDTEESCNTRSVQLFELDEFASQHNVPDPALIYRVVEQVVRFDKRRRDRERAQEAGQKIMGEINDELAALSDAIEGTAKGVQNLQPPTEIRATRIVLVDSAGMERIILDAASTEEDRGAAISVRSTNENTSLELVGTELGVSVQLIVDNEDVVSLLSNLHHKPGKPAASVDTGSWFTREAKRGDVQWIARPEDDQ